MQNRFLSGNYAPVTDELEVSDLAIEGEIPKDLHGVYMRNGPNPAFPPISYTYPLDGDGMIHAVYLQDGRASYKNRFVKTKGLLAEQRAGKAIYGGILQPIMPDPKLLGPDGDYSPFKNGAFIHIIRHAQQYLAMWEGGPAYEMNAQLETLGEWVPKKASTPFNIGPHTRYCPKTGELWLINYDLSPPYLTVYRLSPQGVLLEKRDIERPYCTMMHDFVLTENYLIFFACPLILDGKNLMSGKDVLRWLPELGSQIGVMTRDSGLTRWFDTEAFFVFHFANAFEEGGKISVDFVRHPNFAFLNPDKTKGHQSFYRAIIDLEKGQISASQHDDHAVEFPRIREDRNSLKHHFVYMPTTLYPDEKDMGFHAVVKHDMVRSISEVHDFGKHCEIGEIVFAPKVQGKREDDGYLMHFLYDRRDNNSYFLILDANDLKRKPLAKMKMLRRVPNGLHGSWFAGDW